MLNIYICIPDIYKHIFESLFIIQLIFIKIKNLLFKKFIYYGQTKFSIIIKKKSWKD